MGFYLEFVLVWAITQLKVKQYMHLDSIVPR